MSKTVSTTIKYLKIVLLLPFSWLYKSVVSIRNTLFDLGILNSQEFNIPVICIGNLTVGGTGKTPAVEYLVRLLGEDCNIAVLSRGYKRKTKGFILSNDKSSFEEIGDEPKQIKLNFPNIEVAVCEKRAVGITKIIELKPQINLVILDDAYQHRYVKPLVNILLMDYNRPIYKDYFLPAGRLRDSFSQRKRADIIICTKTPPDISEEEKQTIQKKLKLQSNQNLFFTTVKSFTPKPLFPSSNNKIPLATSQAIILTAIANPKPFIKKIAEDYTVTELIIRADHHTFNKRDFNVLQEYSEKNPEAFIVMTQKDAVKLLSSKILPEHIRNKLFYIEIYHQFIDNETKFKQLLFRLCTKKLNL